MKKTQFLLKYCIQCGTFGAPLVIASTEGIVAAGELVVALVMCSIFWGPIHKLNERLVLGATESGATLVVTDFICVVMAVLLILGQSHLSVANWVGYSACIIGGSLAVLNSLHSDRIRPLAGFLADGTARLIVFFSAVVDIDTQNIVQVFGILCIVIYLGRWSGAERLLKDGALLLSTVLAPILGRRLDVIIFGSFLQSEEFLLNRYALMTYEFVMSGVHSLNVYFFRRKSMSGRPWVIASASAGCVCLYAAIGNVFFGQELMSTANAVISLGLMVSSVIFLSYVYDPQLSLLLKSEFGTLFVSNVIFLISLFVVFLFFVVSAPFIYSCALAFALSTCAIYLRLMESR